MTMKKGQDLTKQEIDSRPTIRLSDLASNIVGNQAIGGLSKKNS